MKKVSKTNHGGSRYTSQALTTREAFERGTDTFNSHDMSGFAEVLAEDVVFKAPGGINGKGKARCVDFFASWFVAFPDARVDVHNVHILDDVAVEEGRFCGTHNWSPAQSDGRRAAHRTLRQSQLHPCAALPGRQAHLVSLDVRSALDARTAWIGAGISTGESVTLRNSSSVCKSNFDT